MQLFLKLLFLGNFLPRGTMPLFAHKAQCLDCVEECGLVHNFIAIQWHLRSVSLYGQNLNLELVGWPRHLSSDQVGWLPKKKAYLKFNLVPFPKINSNWSHLNRRKSEIWYQNWSSTRATWRGRALVAGKWGKRNWCCCYAANIISVFSCSGCFMELRSAAVSAATWPRPMAYCVWP